MKNLFANLNPSISQQMVNLADQVTYRRPSANRTFDQIFMHGGDMIQQTMLMHSFLSDKDVLFLGDGDGMSMMLGCLQHKDLPLNLRASLFLTLMREWSITLINFLKISSFQFQ